MRCRGLLASNPGRLRHFPEFGRADWTRKHPDGCWVLVAPSASLGDFVHRFLDIETNILFSPYRHHHCYGNPLPLGFGHFIETHDSHRFDAFLDGHHWHRLPTHVAPRRHNTFYSSMSASAIEFS